MATGVRTGAVDEPLGWNRRSPAENGSKSLKGGRTVREGVSISGTAAADLERDGGGFLRGLERKSAAQASSASGEASPIPKMRQLAHCIQWPEFGRAVR